MKKKFVNNSESLDMTIGFGANTNGHRRRRTAMPNMMRNFVGNDGLNFAGAGLAAS